jgi:hypothetical protein
MREATAPKQANYFAVIKDSEGSTSEESDHELSQRAEEWADRKLFDASPNSYAEIISAHMVGRNGQVLITRVERSDAIARILKKKGGPATKNMAKKTAPLKNGMKVSNYHAKFLRG